MKKLFIIASVAVFLAGCSTSASRRADCEAQGVSRDACYLAEQNRQSAINGAAEKQALENAQSLYPQKAQSAKKSLAFTRHFNGMTFIRDNPGQLSVDGKLAAKDEENAAHDD